MILDERAEFCDATALNTGAAGTYNIGDIMDMSVARDMGNGQPLYLQIQVTTAVTSGGAATVQFQLVSDATSSISTTTQTIHSKTDAIGKADLVAGYTLTIPLPPEGSKAYERYIGVQQVTGTAALTAGAVNAFLTCDPSGWKAVPDATN